MTMPPLLAALTGRRGPAPVWFMRQAGRSLPEYRQLRARVGLPMLEACLVPEVAAEATVQPVRRHGVDAAVLFSDIMIPLRLAGVGVEIEPGVGPVLDHPYRTRQAIDELTRHSYGSGSWTDAAGNARDCGEGTRAVRQAVALAVRELGATPLIGFAGAPFTLAAYMVEGRPSRDHLAARALAASDPGAWDELMGWCARVTGDFLASQVEAGASAAQLFDSWVGSLSPRVYRDSAAPYSRRVASRLARARVPMTGRRAPLIHFGTGSAPILADMAAVGADCVGVDWKTDLEWAIEQVPGKAVQGNLDPALLQAPWDVIEQAVRHILAAGRAAPGHIFNLGHGVPPTMDPTVLTRIVELVHDAGR